MNKLPQVLQKEIWEYVRGDREYWKIQHDIVVLGLRFETDSPELWSKVRKQGKFLIEWGQMHDKQRWSITIYAQTAQWLWEMVARYPPTSSREICLNRVLRLISQF